MQPTAVCSDMVSAIKTVAVAALPVSDGSGTENRDRNRKVRQSWKCETEIEKCHSNRKA